MVHHALVGRIRHSLDSVTVVHSHLGIVLVLDDGVSESITHPDTSEVDEKTFFLQVSVEDSGCHGRCVMATIALTYEVFRRHSIIRQG